MYSETIIISLVFIILLIEPNILKNFSTTMIGRLFFVAAIVAATMYKTYLGVLLIVILVTLNQVNMIEPMTSNSDSMKEFRNSNCKKNVLYKDDKKVSINDVEKLFPQVNFDGNKCDPCNESCKFSVSSTTEQLANEESVRPQSSSQFRGAKEAAKNKNGDEPKPCNGLCKSKKTSGIKTNEVDQ